MTAQPARWAPSRAPAATPALPRGTTAALAAVALLPFAGHLLFGANSSALALLFTALAAALLLALTALQPGARTALAARPLAVPAVLFVTAAAALTLTLTPWAQSIRPPLVAGPDLSSGLVELLKLAGAACAFAAGFAVARSDAATRRWFQILTFAFAAFAAWALLAFMADPQGVYGFKRVIGGGRLAGAFGSANSAATVLGVGVLVGLAGLLRAADLSAHRGGRGRGVEKLLLEGWPSALGLALCGAALMLTASRGGITSTLLAALGLGLWGAGRSREGRLWIRRVGLGLLVLLAVLALNGGELAVQRFGLALEDAEVRRAIFEAHWRAFQASPLVGYGPGSFEAINDAIMTPGNYDTLWRIRAAHNAWLEQLETVGLLGFLPLLALVAWPLARITLAARDPRRRGVVWLRATTCAALLIGLHGLSDYALQEPSIVLAFATLLGVAYAAAVRDPKPKG
ncbi:O-antigen ligase [Caulobacter sp. 17J80-11]|uniref:O-antigen ligase family protein n=1 Tax=Caulobacter sp. 17J80-11 TaxID=2763502 RepID=UPI0016539EEA|nr:O-antigen ligase family protein [Caulobacter sp. 17J80-11]MBC6982485.1 O-antigen ligase family protein [Caulobacter sp. 17J80-11]